MHHERLVTGVAAVFAAIAIVLSVTALVTTPAVFFVALVFAAAAYLLYDQLSGRMAARVYRRVEQRARVDGDGRGDRNRGGGFGGRAVRGRRGDGSQRGQSGGFGAGQREPWEPPRGGRSARGAAAREAAARQAATGPRRTAARPNRPGPSPADRAAYETLGVDPAADRETIREAYRERVKEAHPDAPSGSEERFKAVKDAYEQLTE